MIDYDEFVLKYRKLINSEHQKQRIRLSCFSKFKAVK